MARVKCAVCGKEFDREKVKCVKHGKRRYAHYNCFPEGEIAFDPPPQPEDTDEYRKLTDYIQELFGDSVNWAMVGTQIKKLIQEQKYSYNGIQKSLHWFYKIQKNPINKEEFKRKGLALIPYIYNQAYEYYFKLYEIQNKNSACNVLQTWETINIQSPRAEVKRKRLFNLDEEGE